ncbi:HalOD1 output domain-containing protein [Haloferax namakaokahaiae]|uniref:HalOD1 output domain-containing protein n=1 Tax=Haloferax namakaokahaiae TaxID=1748331 RepID=A0ABD5ZE73_9EURY
MSTPVENTQTHSRAPNISEAVVQALAAVKETDPISVDPLYNAIDPEALDMLFAPTLNGEQRPGGAITFELMNCLVTVTVEAGDVHIDTDTRSER